MKHHYLKANQKNDYDLMNKLISRKYLIRINRRGEKLIPRKFQFGGIPTLTLPD